MTITIVRPNYFDAPTITPLQGTLLDAATVAEGIGWLEPSDLFESFNCLVVDRQAVFPCPAVLLAVPAMTAPSTATTGGALAAGTYRAVVTAINSRGETIASNEVSQVTTGSTSTITWNWTNVAGETGYRLYITDVNGAAGSETFVIQLAADVVTYVWTGTPANDDVTRPPTSNSATVPATKTFDGTSGDRFQDGIRFAVYGGLVCKAPGFDRETAMVEAQKVFLARETVGVARALMQSRFTTPAATDLTPAGGAVNPEVGLAILEGDASTKYAGVPTIHVPRSIGSLLWTRQSLTQQGDGYFSKQGSKVASDGGYENPNNSPAGVAAPAGEKWIYSSGEVVVARGDLVVRTDIDRATNEEFILVERAYVAAIDCLNSAVRVKVA